jgi:hypothetical protein
MNRFFDWLDTLTFLLPLAYCAGRGVRFLASMTRTVVHNPDNTYDVTELYVFLSEGEGGEGICAGPLSGAGTLVTVVSSKRPKAEKMIPMLRTRM